MTFVKAEILQVYFTQVVASRDQTAAINGSFSSGLLSLALKTLYTAMLKYPILQQKHTHTHTSKTHTHTRPTDR